MTPDRLSPYAAALGARAERLHPRMRAYVAAIPSGRVGVGHGVFERVGCRSRTVRVLLGPLLRLLERRGAVYAGWAEDVPFTVRNRDGGGRSAERTLHLPHGDLTLCDRVRSLPRGRIADRLGQHGVLAAVFRATASDGALELRSTRVGLLLGGLRIRIPSCIAPRIRLIDGIEHVTGLQRVALTVDVPLLGRIHEYAGTFRYRIEEDA